MIGPSIFSPTVIGVVVLVVLLAYGGGRAQQWHRDEVRHTKQVAQWKAEADAAKAKREAEWVRAVDRGEADLKAKINERDGQLVQANVRVAGLDSTVASCRAAGVGRVLNESIRESAATTGAGAKPEGGATAATGGADVALGDWAKWSVNTVNLYARCRDQVIGWQTFYGGLRGAQ